MPHIAFVSTMSGSPFGGSEELWTQAADRLLDRGVQISASAEFWPNPHARIQHLIERNVPFYWRDTPRIDSLSKRLLRRAKREIGIQHCSQEKRWLEAQKPDLVLISQGHYTEGSNWFEACCDLNIPYSILSHVVSEMWWPEDVQTQRLRTWFSAALQVYFVSKGNQMAARTQLALSLSDSKVVRNPYNVSRDFYSNWPETGDCVRLACVGRLHPPTKGQDILLNTLAKPKWKERSLEVSFYGDGPYAQTLKNLSELLSLDKVYFHGFTPNVEDIWQAHHGLILTSRVEGLPLVIVEAMMCGRPCIVTDVAGNAELIEEGITGFIASSPKVESVDAALERAWQEKDCLRVLGERAAQRAREIVSVDPARDFANELLTLL